MDSFISPCTFDFNTFKLELLAAEDAKYWPDLKVELIAGVASVELRAGQPKPSLR